MRTTLLEIDTLMAAALDRTQATPPDALLQDEFTIHVGGIPIIQDRERRAAVDKAVAELKSQRTEVITI